MFVIARPGEPFEALREYRRQRHFIPSHERRRAKIQKALRRQKWAA